VTQIRFGYASQGRPHLRFTRPDLPCLGPSWIGGLVWQVALGRALERTTERGVLPIFPSINNPSPLCVTFILISSSQLAAADEGLQPGGPGYLVWCQIAWITMLMNSSGGAKFGTSTVMHQLGSVRCTQLSESMIYNNRSRRWGPRRCPF
jgi:hypothetical protein